MPKSRIPSPQKLWVNFEQRVLGVVTYALELLRVQTALPLKEPDLNFRMNSLLRDADRTLSRQNQGLDKAPIWEGQSQPVAGDTVRTPRVKKKPDFQYELVDTLEPDPDKAYKYYTIECKRLGKPPKKDRPLNRQYVSDGILRYVTEEHAYGKGSPSGAMIGYLQNMPPPKILAEVNAFAGQKGLPPLNPSGGRLIMGRISRLNQRLDRPEVPPTPFALRHLWVDLRSCYPSLQD